MWKTEEQTMVRLPAFGSGDNMYCYLNTSKVTALCPGSEDKYTEVYMHGMDRPFCVALPMDKVIKHLGFTQK